MKYIEKQIEDEQTGAIAGYHEITLLKCDYLNKIVETTMASYASKKAKDNGKNALSFNTFTFTNAMPDTGESAHDWSLNQLIQPKPEDFVPENYVGYVNPYIFAGGKIKETNA